MASVTASYTTKYLIIGGGIAAASALEALVEADPGAKGATTVVTAEDRVPYHRPPLSKGYLIGEEKPQDLPVLPEEWYSQNGIEFMFRRKGRLIDPATRVCELELNKSIKFEKALLATGASARRWESYGRGLEGIYVLRTVQDSDRIRRAAEDWNRVAIIGSGFIAMELASALAQMDIRPTVITPDEKPWASLGDPQVSEFFYRYFEKRGVGFVLGDQPAGFNGTGIANCVHTTGGKKIACDGVIVAIGDKPNDWIARESRIRVENGIVVDETLATNIPRVWAAGDVVNFPDVVTGDRRRVPHWDNAKAQGALAGRNLAGAGESFRHLSCFFSDVFDLSWEFFGTNENPDRIIRRGDIQSTSATTLFIRDGVVKGAFMIRRSAEETEAVKKLIENRVNVDGKDDVLADTRKELASLLD